MSGVPDVFFLHASWGPRPDDFAGGAGRLHRFLTGLAALDPVYAAWTALDRRSNRGAPASLDLPALERLCERGVYRTSVRPRGRLVGSGFGVTLFTAGRWNLSLLVGIAWTSAAGRSSVSLNLPYSGDAGSRVLRAETLTGLFRLVVDVWDPDVGAVRSRLIDEAIEDRAEPGIDVGWLTYVADRRLPSGLPELSDVSVVPTGAGRLIVAARPRFSAANPRHLDRLRRLSAALDAT